MATVSSSPAGQTADKGGPRPAPWVCAPAGRVGIPRSSISSGVKHGEEDALTVLADTSRVHARESLSYWNDAISTSIYPVHVERAAHGPFRGRAAEFRVGWLGAAAD